MKQVKLKPFSVSKGKKELNWWAELTWLKQYIDKPYEQRTVEEDNHREQLEDLALDWVTCACGNQCEILPRNSHGEPEDAEIFELGCDFAGAVADTDVEQATEILENIEKRSEYLIKEILKEQKNGTDAT